MIKQANDPPPDEPIEAPVPAERAKRIPAKWVRIGLISGTLVIGAAGLVFAYFRLSQNGFKDAAGSSANKVTVPVEQPGLSDAEKAGKQLSNNQCEGSGVPRKLGASPMEATDFSIVIPYGLMAGGHVTPIDHQYFAPRDNRSARDSYEVFAMTDSNLVDIGERTTNLGTEYRLVFTVSCTFLYYYDLVTSLTPDIKKVYDDARSDMQSKKAINIPLKQGQLIGRIGGQTLDFAVWDTTKPLKGFVNPDSYQGESWKLYTADPLDYYSDDLKNLILSRYVRTAEPRSGKIDYDIDGRLIGNWFLEGSGGYSGPGEGQPGYWKGHLAIAPDHFDPDAMIVSIGYLAGSEGSAQNQFMIKDASPHPRDAGTGAGLIKYELSNWSYVKANGQFWDRGSYAEGVKAWAELSVRGTVLFQLLENQKLKFEYFAGSKAAQVSGFTANAQIYVR